MTGLPPNLGAAARAYLEAMPKGEIVAFPIHSLDCIGLPVWVVALFPDDPRFADIMPYGVGYGIDDEQAVLSSLGECMEMIGSVLTLPSAKRTRASWRDLVTVHGPHAAADPLTLGLPAGSPVGRDTRLDWVESRRLRDGATVLVPIDVVALNQKELAEDYVPFTTLITNGMGAGPNVDWAVGHGLLELLQRDGNGLLFKALDQGIVLDLPDPPPEAIAPILERFERAGIKAMPKFATDEFGLCNVYCVGHEMEGREPPLPIMLTACGEASHPDREHALIKAMCEFAASRVRKAFAHGPTSFVGRAAPRGYVERFIRQSGTGVYAQESRAFETMRDWSVRRPAEIRAWLAGTVHAVRGQKAFTDLPTTPAEGSRRAGVIAGERVEAAGLDVLYVDLTPPGWPVSVVKAITPGLEVETMSYARIGERNTRKLVERDDPLIRFGASTDTLKPVRLTPEAIARFGSQPLLDTERLASIVGTLYPLYREPRGASRGSCRSQGRGMSLRFAYNTNGCGSHRLAEALEMMAEGGLRRCRVDARPSSSRSLCRKLGARRAGAASPSRQAWLRIRHRDGCPFPARSARQARADSRHRRPGGPAEARRLPEARPSTSPPFSALKRCRFGPACRSSASTGRRRTVGLSRGLAKVVAYAERNGVVAAFEPEPGMLIETPAQWEALDVPGLALALDTGHCLVTQEIEPADAIRRWGSNLATVSIEDMKRGDHLHLPFGQGDMDVPSVLDALEAVGFDKLVCVELSRESPQADKAIPASIAWLRSCRVENGDRTAA